MMQYSKCVVMLFMSAVLQVLSPNHSGDGTLINLYGLVPVPLLAATVFLMVCIKEQWLASQNTM